MALIDRADLPFRAGEWLVVRAAAVVVGAVVGSRAAGREPVLRGRRRRCRRWASSCRPWSCASSPHGARRSSSVSCPTSSCSSRRACASGFGLPQALDAVARDTAEPASKEFSRALAETRIGTDITDALERMGERMDSVVDALDRHVDPHPARRRRQPRRHPDARRPTTLRERESLHRQVSTLSAEGRLSAYILIALPIFIFLYMTEDQLRVRQPAVDRPQSA